MFELPKDGHVFLVAAEMGIGLCIGISSTIIIERYTVLSVTKCRIPLTPSMTEKKMSPSSSMSMLRSLSLESTVFSPASVVKLIGRPSLSLKSWRRSLCVSYVEKNEQKFRYTLASRYICKDVKKDTLTDATYMEAVKEKTLLSAQAE